MNTGLPPSIVLFHEAPGFAETLSEGLGQRGVSVVLCHRRVALDATSAGLLADFYVLDLGDPSADGLAQIRQLRRNSDAPMLVRCAVAAPQAYCEVLRAGADCFLSGPMPLEHIVASIEALHRRAQACAVSLGQLRWTLVPTERLLLAPDGARVELTLIDLELLHCVAQAVNKVVTRQTLCQRLGRPVMGHVSDGIPGIVHRLRRRTARVTRLPFPILAKPKVGYEFRGDLTIE
jgi:two-component system, OmpR family, response regulator